MSRRVLVLCGALATALAGLVVGFAAAADDDYGYGAGADDDHDDVADHYDVGRGLLSVDPLGPGRGAAAERPRRGRREPHGDRHREAGHGDDSLDTDVSATERRSRRGAHPPWRSRCRRACRRSALRAVPEWAEREACGRRGRRGAVRARRLLRQRAHGEERRRRDPRAAEARRPLSVDVASGRVPSALSSGWTRPPAASQPHAGRSSSPVSSTELPAGLRT